MRRQQTMFVSEGRVVTTDPLRSAKTHVTCWRQCNMKKAIESSFLVLLELSPTTSIDTILQCPQPQGGKSDPKENHETKKRNAEWSYYCSCSESLTIILVLSLNPSSRFLDFCNIVMGERGLCCPMHSVHQHCRWLVPIVFLNSVAYTGQLECW